MSFRDFLNENKNWKSGLDVEAFQYNGDIDTLVNKAAFYQKYSTGDFVIYVNSGASKNIDALSAIGDGKGSNISKNSRTAAIINVEFDPTPITKNNISNVLDMIKRYGVTYVNQNGVIL